MNKIVTQAMKVTLAAGALAAALAGCCMFGSDKACCKDRCGCACRETACCEKKCDGQKSHGVNTSMTVGVGTDGIHAGGAANVGSHGVSANAGTDMH